MVLILDGNPNIGSRLWSERCDLICLRHLFRSRPVSRLMSAACYELQFNISTLEGDWGGGGLVSFSLEKIIWLVDGD